MMRTETIAALHQARPAILPSLLLCDFGNLEREIDQLQEAGFRALHLDVMDGVFVPNFTYGLTVVSAIRKLTELPLDVHLMMVHPENYVQQFADAGADLITIHAEAVDDPRPVLEQIRNAGAASGLAVNPGTPATAMIESLDFCDLALVMSVNAGFGGQSFIDDVLVKLTEIRNATGGDEILLQIDGGINIDTIHRAGQFGADLFVAGSAVFRESDYGRAHRHLLSKLETVDERL